MIQGTGEDLGELLSTLFVGVIVLGFNPISVFIGGILFIPNTIPAAVLEQPIVKDMMFIGMIQYIELWMLFAYLWSEYIDHRRPITPRDVGALLLDTIPFYGLAFYVLLTPINIVLKIILIIYSIIGGLPTMAILADLINAPWLLPRDFISDP